MPGRHPRAGLRAALAVLVGLAVVLTLGSRPRAAVTPLAALFVYPELTRNSEIGPYRVALYVPDRSSLAYARAAIYTPLATRLSLPADTDVRIGTVRVLREDGSDEQAVLVSKGTVGGSCAPGAHRAVWRAEVRFGRSTIPLEFAVDDTPPGDLVRGEQRILFCLPPPRGPGGLPGGLRIVDVSLTLDRVIRNPPDGGVGMWKAFVVPYLPGTVTPAPAREFEAHAAVAYPETNTASARVAGRSIAIRGRLEEAADAMDFTEVQISRVVGGSWLRVRTVESLEDGTYTATVPVRPADRGKIVTIGLHVPSYYGGCDWKPIAPGGCVSASSAPPPDRVIAVRVPRR